MAFSQEEVQIRFERNATELLQFIITTAGKVLIKRRGFLVFIKSSQICFSSY
jgi:hypothetical protein